LAAPSSRAAGTSSMSQMPLLFCSPSLPKTLSPFPGLVPFLKISTPDFAQTRCRGPVPLPPDKSIYTPRFPVLLNSGAMSRKVDCLVKHLFAGPDRGPLYFDPRSIFQAKDEMFPSCLFVRALFVSPHLSALSLQHLEVLLYLTGQ